MAVIELAALLSGATFALSVPVAGMTCAADGRRWLRLARPILAVAAVAVLALVFVAHSAPPVEAVSAIAFGITMLALGVHLSMRAYGVSYSEMCAWTEPVWWASFEESFWDHVG